MKALSTAILGCGAVTNVLYRLSLQKLGNEIELMGAVDLNRKGPEELLKEFPRARYFADWRQALEELHPDAAIIALPHFLHCQVSVAAMRMGVHVFCEKPMAINSAECDEIEAVASETGRVFAVNLERRRFPSVQEIKRMIAARAWGNPVAFEIAEGAPYGWPAMSFSFFNRRISGGGVLMDSGVHTLDLLQWWLGAVEVSEFLDDAAPNGVECDCEATLMAGGAHGSLRMSRSAELANVYRLEFERGWIEWDLDDGARFRLSLNGGDVVRAEVQCDANWTSGQRFIFAVTEHLRNFARACRGQPAEGLVLAAEARTSVDIITRCYEKRKELIITQ